MNLYSKHHEEEQGKWELVKYRDLETNGYVKTIDKFSDLSLLYGTTKGHIAVANYEMYDLSPDIYYTHAHSSEVTGVSVSPSSNQTFVSCSLDRNCLLWDTKKTKAASGLLSKYENQITAVRWTTQGVNKELIMIGDEIGNVITLDPRCPNKILDKTRVSNRPITSFSFNGTKRFGVVSRSAAVDIMEVESDGGYKQVLKHSGPNMIYSMCWDAHDKKTFYVVGENKYAEKIEIDA
jgi:WD40 repeat protein